MSTDDLINEHTEFQRKVREAGGWRMPRKIIQIMHSASTHVGGNIHALCDDGSVWIFVRNFDKPSPKFTFENMEEMPGTWIRLPEIPHAGEEAAW